LKYLCLKCKTGFDDATAVQGTTKDGRQRLTCPACGSQKYKYQDEGETLERRRAYAKEQYRKLKSTSAGRVYLAAKSVRYREQRDKEIKRRRICEKRTVKKDGYTSSDIQQMPPEKLVKNWKKIVGTEK